MRMAVKLHTLLGGKKRKLLATWDLPWSLLHRWCPFGGRWTKGGS